MARGGGFGGEGDVAEGVGKVAGGGGAECFGAVGNFFLVYGRRYGAGRDVVAGVAGQLVAVGDETWEVFEAELVAERVGGAGEGGGRVVGAPGVVGGEDRAAGGVGRAGEVVEGERDQGVGAGDADGAAVGGGDEAVIKRLEQLSSGRDKRP